jgi:hypothetical protein
MNYRRDAADHEKYSTDLEGEEIGLVIHAAADRAMRRRREYFEPLELDSYLLKYLEPHEPLGTISLRADAGFAHDLIKLLRTHVEDVNTDAAEERALAWQEDTAGNPVEGMVRLQVALAFVELAQKVKFLAADMEIEATICEAGLDKEISETAESFLLGND